MTRRFGSLVVLALVGGLPSLQVAGNDGESKSALIPELGWRIDDKEDAAWLQVPGRGLVLLTGGGNELTMTSSANLAPRYELQLDEIAYALAVNGESGDAVFFLATSSEDFVSPEGVKVGQHFAAVSQPEDHRLGEEPGWACFVCLPSGWAASFPALDKSHRWLDCDEHKRLNSRVVWFFKRAGTCE
jgi:hypothetical protein